MRLDLYLAQTHPEHSRSVWQKFIKRGQVKVNNVVATVSKIEVSDDDDIVIDDTVQKASAIELPIIYEDENVTVIDKPVGVLTHAKGALSDEFTVADFMRDRTTFNTETDRPGIVHRLDRDTSGVIICARNEATATMLARQFNQRTLKKTYAAVLSKLPKQAPINIDLPIGRNPKKPSTFRVDPNGKAAETYLEIVNEGVKKCLVELRPKTGRTHQLRVHTAYIGSPIVGDRFYGRPASRLFLHAHKLEVTIPGSPNERKTFESAIPKSFASEVVS